MATADVCPPAGGAPECRICRCTAEETGEMLFAPCLCKGSLEWVHPTCLEQWRQAAPTSASRVRCDMCHGPFELDRQRPSMRDFCRPCGSGVASGIAAIAAVELATLGCGYIVNLLALLTGVEDSQYELSPSFDLHLNGWTLLLPQAACFSVARKARAAHRSAVEANPAYESGRLARLLFGRLGPVGCYAAIFGGVFALVLLPMGYLGKLVIWIGHHGWGDADGDEPATQVSWRLDPAHFYLASLVFCLASFVVYLIMMSVLLARRHPDRLGCCKVVAAVVSFELFVVLGGYLVKALAVATGVYDSDGSDGSGSQARVTGWAAVQWRADWNHHVLALTAFMPVVHSVFFLHRFRAAFPRWKAAYPAACCTRCLTAPLEQWSARKASAATALLALLLLHLLGLLGKLLLAAMLGIPLRSGSEVAQHADEAEACRDATAGGLELEGCGEEEEAEFVLGWGADYTHYFIGFVLLYLVAGLVAAAAAMWARYHNLAESTGSTVRTAGSAVRTQSPRGDSGVPAALDGASGQEAAATARP